MSAKPIRVGVLKLTSCDGCQIALLDLEEQLLLLAGRYDFAEFGVASSARSDGPFDVALVEGSISTEQQRRHLLHMREQATTLVAFGTCACTGGIQALRNASGDPAFGHAIYPHPEHLASLATCEPVGSLVKVDLELPGCPVNPELILELLTAVAVGRRPQLPDTAVCTTCKLRDAGCLLVAKGQPCLGPITRAGCGAICPAYARGCYGCYGPRESANVEGFVQRLAELGLDDQQIAAQLALFASASPAIAAAIAAHGGAPGIAPTEGR